MVLFNAADSIGSVVCARNEGVQHRWTDYEMGKANYCEGNPSKHFFHKRSHIDWPVIEGGNLGLKPSCVFHASRCDV